RILRIHRPATVEDDELRSGALLAGQRLGQRPRISRHRSRRLQPGTEEGELFVKGAARLLQRDLGDLLVDEQRATRGHERAHANPAAAAWPPPASSSRTSSAFHAAASIARTSASESTRPFFRLPRSRVRTRPGATFSPRTIRRWFIVTLLGE